MKTLPIFPWQRVVVMAAAATLALTVPVPADIPAGNTPPRVIPQALEGSNVSAIEAMTRLIDQSRSFETQIRIIKETKTLDESGASMMKTA